MEAREAFKQNTSRRRSAVRDDHLGLRRRVVVQQDWRRRSEDATRRRNGV